MASLEWTQLWWNGKLNSSSDLLYYDKINVDVVHPPYATRDRNSSYFLKTRRWYMVDKWLNEELFYELTDWDQFDIVDVEVLWNNRCEENDWIIYYMCITKEGDEKLVLSRTIDNWIINNDINLIYRSWEWCQCSDEKFFKTTYVKWDWRYIFKNSGDLHSETWIQINKVEWGAMRWYFSDEKIRNKEKEFDWWSNIKAWDYLVTYNTTWMEWDGFSWQVRTIVDYNSVDWELVLDSAWSWFQDWENRIEWNNVSYMILSDWWEVVWFTSWDWVAIALDNINSLTIRWLGNPEWNAKCVLSSTASTDRIFLLYDNWWIHFWWIGRDKFFDAWDAMFCWADKHSIVAYRDFILAMGNDKMAVAVPDNTGQYFHMYNQSSTIWVKNKYAFWEYNWDLLICSNDNRLLALKIANNVWQYMLEYEDIWQYINPYLKAMLPSDKCYISVDDNELRVYINTLSDVDRAPNNTRTLVLKYNTIFWVWTCDKLWYALLRGSKYWFYYWDSVYTRCWNKDSVSRERNRDWISELEYKEYAYNIWVSAFLLENEENWMTANGRTADLFSLAMLNKLILLLWMWRYDNSNTQLKITEYRNGFWYEQVISSLTNNEWLDKIWAVYEWSSIELSECVLSDIKDGSNVIRTTCEKWHKIQKPIIRRVLSWKDRLGNDFTVFYSEHDYQLTDHRVCVNDEVYKIAPTMPLTIELWDQERYNSQIYIELVSNSDDVINFWWFLAELSLAKLWYKWADWEYMIEVESGC